MTQSIEELERLFDAALVLRDEGKYAEAIASLDSLTHLLDESDHQRRLLAHAHIQIAHMYKKLDNHISRANHLQIAVRIAPGLELASLALFHALIALNRFGDAMQEMVRYVSTSNSPGYRELLSEGYGDDLPPVERELAAKARAYLARFV